jgi:very-short-patch-repair endonuclease
MSHPSDWMERVSDQLLAQLAVSQHGLVTRAQTLGLLSHKQLRQRLSSGRLEGLRPGVYRFAGASPSWEQELLAACLAAGAGAVASHLAAGAIWAMPGVARGQPEILVPSPRWVRLPGVRVHRSDRLFKHHITDRDGVPVTTPARSLFDMSAVVGPMFLGRLINSSLRRHIVTIPEIRRCCDDVATRGRRRLTIVRAVLDERPSGFDPGDSDPEAQLVGRLIAAGFPVPVQQHQVIIGRRIFLLDLAYPEHRIAIEYDSWEHHGNRVSFDRDSRRRASLTLDGWTYLGVTAAWSENDVVEAVSAAFRRSCRDGVPSQGPGSRQER